MSQAGSPIWGPLEEFPPEPMAAWPQTPATQRTGGPVSVSQRGSDHTKDDPKAGYRE